MKAIVEYQGKVYEGEEMDSQESQSAIADALFNNLDGTTRFKLRLA